MIGSLVIPPIASGYLQPNQTSNLTETLTEYNEGTMGPGHCENYVLRGPLAIKIDKPPTCRKCSGSRQFPLRQGISMECWGEIHCNIFLSVLLTALFSLKPETTAARPILC